MILRMQMCVMMLRLSQRPIISSLSVQSFVKEKRTYLSSEFACSSLVALRALLESPLFIFIYLTV